MGSICGMGPDYHVEQVFWTPVIVDHLADTTEMNAALEAAILARRSECPGAKRSNVGGWQSDKEAQRWGGAAMERLIAHVRQLASANTVDSKAADGAVSDWSIEAWATVSESGAYVAPHAHGGCYWSAVYYVRVDEGEGGELVLHDPRLPAAEMHAPHLRFKHSGGERAIRTQAQAGMLVLFPAWLIHSVNGWRSDGLRISLVINLAAKRHRPIE